MITPILEKLILRGDAEFKIFSASSKSQVLEVQAKAHIVITDIWYNDFIDSNDSLFDAPPEGVKGILNNSVHKLKLESQKTSDFFVIRDQVNMTPAGGGNVTYSPQGQQHFNVYLKHEDNVYIDLTHLPFQADIVITDGVYPAEADPPYTPNGYGNTTDPTAQPVNLKWNFSGGIAPFDSGEFRAAGKFLKPTLGEEISYLETNWPTSKGTALISPDPALDTFTRNFPMINIGYVIIKGTANDLF